MLREERALGTLAFSSAVCVASSVAVHHRHVSHLASHHAAPIHLRMDATFKASRVKASSGMQLAFQHSDTSRGEFSAAYNNTCAHCFVQVTRVALPG